MATVQHLTEYPTLEPYRQQRYREPMKPKSDSLIAIGYITAPIAVMILPLPIALAGVICGCINLSRDRVGHGIAQIILNATCGIFGTMLGYMALSQM